MQYYGVIETKQNSKRIREYSEYFDNKLQAECWLHACCREARDLKIKITDHYLCEGVK